MPELTNLIWPAILCGGSGTRLWPASRESMPKQFIPLIDEHSPFQATVGRIGDRAVFGRPVVLAHSDTRFVVAEQLASSGATGDIVLEPVRRDSAAAVAVAACHAARKDPRALVLILAADHVIGDAEAFVEACRAAALGAREGFIMTLGVRPAFPATGYGYIRMGAPISGTGAFRVESFVEKPDQARAGRYVEEGYLWNSGYFLFRADVMLEELEARAPAVLAAARASLAEGDASISTSSGSITPRSRKRRRSRSISR